MKRLVRNINNNRDIKLLPAIYYFFLVMPEYNKYELSYVMLVNEPCGCNAVLRYLLFFLTKYDTIYAFLLALTLCTRSFYVILAVGDLVLLIFVLMIRVHRNDRFRRLRIIYI